MVERKREEGEKIKEKKIIGDKFVAKPSHVSPQVQRANNKNRSRILAVQRNHTY